MSIVSVVPCLAEALPAERWLSPPDAARKALEALAPQLGALFFGAFRACVLV